MTRRVRSFCTLALVALPVFAGCVLGRPRTASAPRTPAEAPKAPPKTVQKPDTAPRMLVLDSIRLRDSLQMVHVADSIARGAAGLLPTNDSASKATALAAAKKPQKAPAASKPCILDLSESPPETRLTYNRVDSLNATTFIGGGFVGHCQGEKNRISADSAEQFQAAGVLNLYGNVKYEDPGRMRLESLRATYFTREERILATGAVRALQLTTGSTFTGQSMEYFRPLVGVRAGTKLIAPDNPVAELIEKDSTGKPGPPVQIRGNTMIDIDDSLLFAVGNVVITRSGLVGRADSATFDKNTERARLIRTAKVINQDSSRKFTLTGDTIDLFSKERQLQRVMALHNATAVNSDVTILAEKIDLRLAAQKLTRAYAYGGKRARAKTPQQDVEADSLDIVMPEQRVSEMRAVGRAVTTGVPDTTKMKSEDRDLLRGDTVVASFDSARFAGDTAQPKVRQITAHGHASSLFQIAAKEGPTFPPALNYSRGKRILVQFDSGQVRDVTIDSSASGAYFEPAADTLSDSTKKKSSKKAPTPAPPRRRGAQISMTSPWDRRYGTFLFRLSNVVHA